MCIRDSSTTVKAGHVPARKLWIGHTLPRGAAVDSVRLDGKRVGYSARRTNRGLEVTVATRPGNHTLEVRAG